MTMRRWALALLAATCVSALAVSAATATPPERVPLIIEDTEIEGACAFVVGVEIIANKEKVTFFSNGRVLVTGKLFVRLTNAENSANSLRLNLTGTVQITTAEKYTGHNLFFLFPEDVGGPGMILTTGRVDVVRTEDGFISELRTRSPTKNVCATLA
jgi:ABC-type amino acid transport substrate-binding protein